MGKDFVCIECPRGCALHVEGENCAWSVSGNFCPKGKAYALSEMISPRRTVTSTVRAKFGRVPVKTDREVLKSNIFLVMEKIRAAYVDSDTEIGTVILADVDGEGTNVVAAKPYRVAGEN